MVPLYIYKGTPQWMQLAQDTTAWQALEEEFVNAKQLEKASRSRKFPNQTTSLLYLTLPPPDQLT